MFWTVPLSIIRSFSLYTQQWYMTYRFVDSLRAGSGWNCCVLILFTSCQRTCMTYTIAVCTVKNSWWWAEELSKTCRVLFQNKFEKLVHLVGFIIRSLMDNFLLLLQYLFCTPNRRNIPFGYLLQLLVQSCSGSLFCFLESLQFLPGILKDQICW